MKKINDKMILMLGAIFAIFSSNIFLLAEAFRGTKINAENAGQYGSFISGYIGTTLSFISMVLLYLTFKNQRESNEKNAQSAYIEKFESKFFEMIKLHRENVAEIGIGDRYGRKIFVMLLREFREIMKLIQEFINKNSEYADISEEEKYDIAYCILFYGVGPNSSRILKSALQRYNTKFINEVIKIFDNKEIKEKIRKERDLKYVPFEGHQSRLGHYYRHLYQSICYVDGQDESIITSAQKYNYVKILRAQLSTHEQAMLFLNSISHIGAVWNEDRLIVKYRFIKNIPEDFFDKKSEIDIKNLYPELIFEWEES